MPCAQVNRNAPLSNSLATHGTPANRPARTGKARIAAAMTFGIGLGLLNDAQVVLDAPATAGRVVCHQAAVQVMHAEPVPLRDAVGEERQRGQQEYGG